MGERCACFRGRVFHPFPASGSAATKGADYWHRLVQGGGMRQVQRLDSPAHKPIARIGVEIADQEFHVFL